MFRNIRNKIALAKSIENDYYFNDVKLKNKREINKLPYRFDIINFLIETLARETSYLEIGVRNPNDNFNKIKSNIKFSVDPGLEFVSNPVDFPVTSDEFFNELRNNNNNMLTNIMRFDVIFIDGLHTSSQVDRDILNSLEFIKDDGFIVLHDCNPPSEFHAREEHNFEHSPAGSSWNGTTWKGFLKWRNNSEVYSCCIDSDWGVGIISKSKKIGNTNTINNEFFEFSILNKYRKEILNLMTFDEFKKILLEEF